MEESDTSPCLWIGFGTVHLAPVTLAINHRVTEEPRLEGTSEDYQVQPFLRKGSLDEISKHPIQPHLDNLQWWGPYHVSLGWLVVVLCIKNFFLSSRQNLSSKVKHSQYCLQCSIFCTTMLYRYQAKAFWVRWSRGEYSSWWAATCLKNAVLPFLPCFGRLGKHYSAHNSLLIC